MRNHSHREFDTASSPAEIHDWPELLAKTVDDAAKLIGAELHLFEANLKAMMEAQAQRVIGKLIVVAALAYGLLFVLGAIAVLLHHALPWWLALGVTGLIVIVIGVIAKSSLSKSAEQESRPG